MSKSLQTAYAYCCGKLHAYCTVLDGLDDIHDKAEFIAWLNRLTNTYHKKSVYLKENQKMDTEYIKKDTLAESEDEGYEPKRRDEG